MNRRAFIALAGAALVAACGRSGPKFHSTDVTGADWARGFDLPDTTGKRRTLADFKGKVVLVFFGYTHCPDVCPTSLAHMAEARRKLGPDGKRVQVVFITVDPKRDTPEVLGRYLAAFDPTFIGLRGTPEETAKTAKEFKVFYKADSGPVVEHTSAIYVFDAKGDIRLYVTDGGNDVDALVADLKTLLS